MGVPKKVRDQGENSEALASEHYDRTTGKRKDPNTPQSSPAEPASSTPSENNAASNDKTEDWEKRFRGLSKTHRELKEAYDQAVAHNEQLNQRLTDLENKLPKSGPAEPAPDPSKSMEERLKAMMTDEERDQYDDNFVAMLARFINNGAPKQDLSQVEDRLNRVEQTQTLSAKDNFWKQVNDNVPDWQRIQESPEFDEWASEYDPLLKATRWKALESTMSTLDYELAIGIFSQFKNLQTKPSESGSSDDLSQDPRYQQVVPDAAASGSGVADDGQPVFRQSFINQFYKDVSLGHYKGKEAEAARIDQQIFEAGQAGRITPD